jgi:hypothetical protein
MPDIVRTQAQLITDFANNTTGAITAQGLRNFVVTVEPDALRAHIASTTNPHSTTYTQVGAAAASHTHPISDITGLQTALNALAPTASPTFSGTVNLGGGTITNGSGLSLSLVNTSLTTYIISLSNSSSTGQTSIASTVNGQLFKWRGDYLGNLNYVAPTSHAFYTGGDFGTGVNSVSIYPGGANTNSPTLAIKTTGNYANIKLTAGGQDTWLRGDFAGNIVADIAGGGSGFTIENHSGTTYYNFGSGSAGATFNGNKLYMGGGGGQSGGDIHSERGSYVATTAIPVPAIRATGSVDFGSGIEDATLTVNGIVFSFTGPVGGPNSCTDSVDSNSVSYTDPESEAGSFYSLAVQVQDSGTPPFWTNWSSGTTVSFTQQTPGAAGNASGISGAGTISDWGGGADATVAYTPETIIDADGILYTPNGIALTDVNGNSYAYALTVSNGVTASYFSGNLNAAQLASGTVPPARLGSGSSITTKFLRGDSTWQSISTGTVSSVGLSLPNLFIVTGSPVTGSGTLTATLDVVGANQVFAGPTSGSSATPLMRSLVSADLPATLNGVNHTIGNLAVPSSVTVTPTGSTSNGVTYGYRIAALNAVGTTLASATATTSVGYTTLTAGHYNLVSWSAVPGATSYKVYGRTSGSELLMATVTTTNYQDTGAATPSGALPGNPSGTKLIVKKWKSQTGNLQEWQSDTASIYSYIDSLGVYTGDALLGTATVSTLQGNSSGGLTINGNSSSGTTFGNGPIYFNTNSAINFNSSTTVSLDGGNVTHGGTVTATTFVGALTGTASGNVASTRTINTTAPITGGGDLSADRTIAMAAATTSVNGYLTSTDWTTFNNKVATSRTISTTAPITGGGDLSANRTIAMAAATTSVDGYLTATNWTTFNNKAGTASPTFTGTVTLPTTNTVGGLSRTVTSVSANYTVLLTDDIILINLGGSGRTMTLPTNAPTGKVYTFIKTNSSGSDSITLSETTHNVNGATTYNNSNTGNQYTALWCIYTGSTWYAWHSA